MAETQREPVPRVDSGELDTARRSCRSPATAWAFAATRACVSVIPPLVAISRSLADHVTAMYAPYGKRPNPNLLYGLVYTVAAVGALLWLLVLRGVPSRGRSAPVLAVVVTTITAALALLLPVSTEYGVQIFPPLWGILAVLPPAAGILAVVLLFRRRHALA